MLTKDAIDTFLHSCQDRGLSNETTRTYSSRLKYFAIEYPELPTTTNKVETFLRKRGETPSKRGKVFDVLKAFYSHVEQQHGIPSPVPSKGPVGRPPKRVPRSVQQMCTTDTGRDRINEKLLQGGALPSESISLSTIDAVAMFVTARRHQHVSPYTLLKYASTFNPFIAHFPQLPTTPETIGEYIYSIKGQPHTRWTRATVIKALYNFLAERLKRPDLHGLVPSYTPKRKLRDTLELSQLQQLWDLPLSPRDRAIVNLLFDTGLREGEIVTLDAECVHPDFLAVSGKTGEHQVPISPDTYELLKQLAPSGPLFTTSKGRMSTHTLYCLIRDLLEQIGVTHGKRGPHMLRHSYARHYMALGGDLMSLKAILGHTKVSTTQIYAELAFTDVKKLHRQQTPLRTIIGENNVPQSDPR